MGSGNWRVWACVLSVCLGLSLPAWAVTSKAGSAQSEAGAGSMGGVLSGQRGVQIIVEGAGVSRWAPGMAVWISEPGAGGRPGLVLAHGEVTSVQEGRAVVVLTQEVKLPKKAVVEPRFVAEARQYGRSLRAQRDGAKRPAKVRRKGPPYQVWHESPDSVEWGESAWLELAATGEVSEVVLRYRAGKQGAFLSQKMTRSQDGLWTTRMSVGRTSPEIRYMQYYVVGLVTLPGEKPKLTLLWGHPARPETVKIVSAPRRPVGQRIDHDPPSRWSHKHDLPLSVQIDKRYHQPTLHFRYRGGGMYEHIPMKKLNAQTWQAVIPGRKVVVPGLAYYVSVVDSKNIVRDGFANRRSPHRVHVTRGRILSERDKRNIVGLFVDYVDWGSKDDHYMRYGLSVERLFFGFLVARLGGFSFSGRSQDLVPTGKVDPDKPDQVTKPTYKERDMNLLGGYAGAELRVGDYFSWQADLRMGIHNEGAALGYDTGIRVGDEMGANLSARYGTLWDLDSGDAVSEQLRVSLSAPVGSSLRLAGVLLHESILQQASKGLRLQIEATWMLSSRLYLLGRGGFAGRDADAPGYTTGGGLRVVF